MKNIFLPAQEGVVGVVIIPFDYEDLPEDRRNKVVPICIEARDRDGNLIDPAWFEYGVAPIREELTDLAQTFLGDRRRVSDIAQASLHKVWYRHGHNTGTKPYARIWRQAIWEARDQAVGGWRERRFRVLVRSVEEMDREFPEHTRDSCDYAQLYDRRMLLRDFKTALKDGGLEEMARVYELLELGDTWVEISRKLGQREDALKHRFYRFRNKFRSNN